MSANNYINGKFVSDASASRIQVTNPATQEVLGDIENSSAATIDAAIEAARKAQGPWERLPAIQRANHLRAISAKIREQKDRIAKIISGEQGKTLDLAEVEVAFTADYMDYMAEWARRLEGEVITSDRPNESIFLTRRAIGVTAGILPWNFPFFLIARKLAPALVTGNTIVIKPSEETPLNAIEFAKIVAETDLPAGVFNLVFGGGAAGAALSGHKGIDLVSFTGSVETGTRIMQAAALNLTRVNLELGGKAPAIVLNKANLELAVRAVHASRVANTGQLCNCAERIYVQRKVADEFTARLADAMKNTRYGNPLATRELDMGPLISKAHLAKVAGFVERARGEGAQVITGGRVADRDAGNHYEPTVLVNCKPDMEIMRKEVFGPVLPIQIVDELDEAIAYANDSEYGLTSSIFSDDINEVMRATRELRFGETYVNREHFEAMQGFHAGRRKSGIGGADGKHGLYEYTETQVVYLQSQ